MKVYKEGTSLYDILLDGWSRGFQVTQTREEAKEMGYAISELFITSVWKDMQDRYESAML